MTTQQPPPKIERALALTALRQRNEQNFKKLGLINPKFTIKFAYIPKHREDVVVSMFPSEMDTNDDIYIELTDGENNPIYDEPVLYKLRRNPYYKQGEYEVIPADPSRNKKSETYLIPLSELEVVAGTPSLNLLSSVAKKSKSTNDKLFESAKFPELANEKDDAHHSSLTIRDLAAIFLKAPVSNKPWLNDIISKHS